MITSLARLKSQLVFAGLALTLITSAGMPLLGGQDAAAKNNHKQRGQHSQVQRDNHKNQNNQREKAQRNQNNQAQGKGSQQHCVVELVAGVNDAPNESCYRTFDEAQAAARSGGEGVQGRHYQESILAVLYDNINYDTSAGTTTLIGAAPDGCSRFTFTWDTLNFNNRVSSAKVYSGCKATFFADSFLSGASKTGSIVNGYDIPAMESFNDLASSVHFSKG